MLVTKYENSYLLKLESHEELTRELKKFCIENEIQNASITAIGAINSITLGFYDTQTQEYKEQSMHKNFELTSAAGIISRDENNEPFLHIHATIADKDFRSYGGHLFRAVTSKTIEVQLRIL